MKKFARLLLAIFSASIALASTAQPPSPSSILTPTANLVIDGIPPIEIALTKKVEAYTAFKPSSIVAWHPTQNALLIRRRVGDTLQLQLVEKPGAQPIALTDFADPISDASFQPKKGEYVLFERDTGGNEVFRLFRLDIATKNITAITPENERASAPAWNRNGDRIVYSTSTIDRFNRGKGAARMATTKLYIADPLKPADAKLIKTFEGARWSNFQFSPDEKKLVFSETISANESCLWMMDIASTKISRITPERKIGDEAVAYGKPHFSHDGKTLFVTSDRSSEFRRLVEIDLTTGNEGRENVLTGHLNFDVEEFSVSGASKRIAFITNEDGSSVLRFLDLDSKKELPRPALLPGEISGLRWKIADNVDADNAINTTNADDVKLLAFNVASAKSPGEIFSYDVGSTKMTRWTNGAAAGLNPHAFVEPKRVIWKSVDGLSISGFLYSPDEANFPGKRPVIINIHGGPEGQARPSFITRNNYIVNELGIAIIYPNVRGSSGFGKTFLALDNGIKREDAVTDIGALLDWITTQPDLDANKVLVMGGSYGGYMTLAVATRYADKIAGGISSAGISNFVTLLTNTESYRRDLMRAEYGDERDPKMNAFLEKISPLNNVAKMKKPMLIVNGKNNPRVPYAESMQIVSQLKKQKTPVWFLMANDEGHGFAKKNNQDFLFYAQIKFIEKTLLP